MEPFEVGDRDEDRGIEPDEQALHRYNIAAFIAWAFVGGLAFFGILILTVIIIEAFGSRSVAPYISFDDILKLFTTFGTLIAGLLGYVLGHYFRNNDGNG